MHQGRKASWNLSEVEVFRELQNQLPVADINPTVKFVSYFFEGTDGFEPQRLVEFDTGFIW